MALLTLRLGAVPLWCRGLPRASGTRSQDSPPSAAPERTSASPRAAFSGGIDDTWGWSEVGRTPTGTPPPADDGDPSSKTHPGGALSRSATPPPLPPFRILGGAWQQAHAKTHG